MVRERSSLLKEGSVRTSVELTKDDWVSSSLVRKSLLWALGCRSKEA
jgi:hypothetical protein